MVLVAKTFKSDQLDRFSKALKGDKVLWLDRLEEDLADARDCGIEDELMIKQALAILRRESGDEKSGGEGNDGLNNEDSLFTKDN